MKRTWTLPGFAALLSIAVVSAVRADPEIPTADDKLSQVLNQLQEVKVKLSIIQANQDAQIRTMQDDITRLKDDVSRLNETVRRLSTTNTNVSASINPNPNPAAAPLVNGTITLENRYSFPATVVVNGTAIRVNPLERRNVSAPLGRFTYSVTTDNGYLAQPESDRFLAAGRDFPITINP